MCGTVEREGSVDQPPNSPHFFGVVGRTSSRKSAAESVSNPVRAPALSLSLASGRHAKIEILRKPFIFLKVATSHRTSIDSHTNFAHDFWLLNPPFYKQTLGTCTRSHWICVAYLLYIALHSIEYCIVFRLNHQRPLPHRHRRCRSADTLRPSKRDTTVQLEVWGWAGSGIVLMGHLHRSPSFHRRRPG